MQRLSTFYSINKKDHFVKSVQIRSFFWSVFSCIQSEYRSEKTLYLDTFHTVRFLKLWNCSYYQKIDYRCFVEFLEPHFYSHCCQHCEKCVQTRTFFWSVFSRIRTEYGEIRSIFPYSVRMRENTDRKNSEFGHFSRSATYI